VPQTRPPGRSRRNASGAAEPEQHLLRQATRGDGRQLLLFCRTAGQPDARRKALHMTPGLQPRPPSRGDHPAAAGAPETGAPGRGRGAARGARARSPAGSGPRVCRPGPAHSRPRPPLTPRWRTAPCCHNPLPLPTLILGPHPGTPARPVPGIFELVAGGCPDFEEQGPGKLMRDHKRPASLARMMMSTLRPWPPGDGRQITCAGGGCSLSLSLSLWSLKAHWQQ
jgi:hypothetical protein